MTTPKRGAHYILLRPMASLCLTLSLFHWFSAAATRESCVVSFPHTYRTSIHRYPSVFIFILTVFIIFFYSNCCFIPSNISMLLSLFVNTLVLLHVSLCTAVSPVNFSQGGSIKEHLTYLPVLKVDGHSGKLTSSGRFLLSVLIFPDCVSPFGLVD